MFQPRYAAFMPRLVYGAGPAEYCESVTDQHQADSPSMTSAGTAGDPGYPGEGLGLPQAGPGAVAGMARRVGALFIDWLACTLVVAVAIRPALSQAQYWTLAVFAVQDFVFTALIGLTLGKLLMRIRVARLDGQRVGFGWSLVRTLLLLTVVPPLIVDRDLRGLHDRAANTAVVRL